MIDRARLLFPTLASGLGALGATVIDLIFPPLDPCTLCRAPLSISSEVRVCAACLERLGRIGDRRCARCGRALGTGRFCASAFSLPSEEAAAESFAVETRLFRRVAPASLCHQCRTVPSALDVGRAYGAYEGYMRSVIHNLKYRGDLMVARGLGELMAWVVSLEPRFAGVELIVPVPLHPKRLRERGFNQATELAIAVGEALDLPVVEAVARVRETVPQSSLGFAERRRNTVRAFETVAPEAVRGREVLIVDDVYTTGATASSVALSLKRAGARRAMGIFAAAGSLEQDFWVKDSLAVHKQRVMGR